MDLHCILLAPDCSLCSHNLKQNSLVLTFDHIINALLTKLVRSRWLGIGLVLFLVFFFFFFFFIFMDLNFVSVLKNANNNLANIQPS